MRARLVAVASSKTIRAAAAIGTPMIAPTTPNSEPKTRMLTMTVKPETSAAFPMIVGWRTCSSCRPGASATSWIAAHPPDLRVDHVRRVSSARSHRVRGRGDSGAAERPRRQRVAYGWPGPRRPPHRPGAPIAQTGACCKRLRSTSARTRGLQSDGPGGWLSLPRERL
jgi:hypothetical protein